MSSELRLQMQEKNTNPSLINSSLPLITAESKTQMGNHIKEHERATPNSATKMYIKQSLSNQATDESGRDILVVGSWLWDPGCQLLAVRSWLWDSGCRLLAVGSLLWNPGCGLLAVGSWL